MFVTTDGEPHMGSPWSLRVCSLLGFILGAVYSAGLNKLMMTRTYMFIIKSIYGLPRWCSDGEPVCQCRRCRRRRFKPWVRKVPWRKKRQPTQGCLPGKSQGQRRLEGYSAWVTQSDTPERLCTRTRTRMCPKNPLCCACLPSVQLLTTDFFKMSL